MNNNNDDNGFGGSYSRPSQEAVYREEESWRAYDAKTQAASVEALNAEIDKLRTEIERLKAWGWRMTSDEELKGFSDLHQEHVMINVASLNGMADEILKFRTENERLIDSLKSELLQLRAEVERLKAPQKILKAEEVTEHGWYWWRKDSTSEWHPREVEWDYTERKKETVLVFWIESACDGQDLYGEFIGPIPYPKPDHADD